MRIRSQLLIASVATGLVAVAVVLSLAFVTQRAAATQQAQAESQEVARNVASLLTLYSVVKIWIGVFWSPAHEPSSGTPHEVGRMGGPLLMVLPTAALFATGIALAVFAGPLYSLCERAAADLLNPVEYLKAVLG